MEWLMVLMFKSNMGIDSKVFRVNTSEECKTIYEATMATKSSLVDVGFSCTKVSKLNKK